jgi:uncharacterized protein YyaL (SSP411 family)
LRNFITAIGCALSLLSCKSSKAAPVAVARNSGENRLRFEKSPYLQQHADNPVWWQPWGEPAFAMAREQHKPIFLSIGYATCHWCHVMERESYQDQDVAAALNASFIAIKVDREERPDVDAIYMEAVQAMTGSGGWPLNVVLTPERVPIFGGTYFPKARLLEVLGQLAKSWRENPAQLQQTSERLRAYLQRAEAQGSLGAIKPDIFTRFVDSSKERFDPIHGGLRGAPKFVPSYALRVLLRIHRRTGNSEALSLVTKTLDEVARGGINDHLGGGFHRYSTDDHWQTPHFEKMLYDQAAMANAYLEAFEVTGEPRYSGEVRRILDYVLRDLAAPEGAFASAEDADSEGVEGKFYVWSWGELENALSPDELSAVVKAFGATRAGNFEGKNLFVLQPGYSDSDRSALATSAVQKLFTIRSQRVRPARDGKILTSWNGLIISSLAQAGRALGEDRYTRAAEKAARFLLENSIDKGGNLQHRWVAGEAKVDALDEDYAFLIQGLIDLYQGDFDPHWLDEAVRLQGLFERQFTDAAAPGYFETSGSDPALLRRGKNFYDNVTPAPNSVEALNLLRLSDLLVDPLLRGKAERLLQAWPAQALAAPSAFPQMLIAVDYDLDAAKEIAIVGALADDGTQALVLAATLGFEPNQVIAAGPPGSAIPLLRDRGQLNGAPTAYVCVNRVCKLPTASAERVRALASQVDRLP